MSSVRNTPLPACIRQLFVPALTASEAEQQQGTLDQRHQRFIFDATREMVEETLSDADADDKRMALTLAKEHKADADDLAVVPPEDADVKKATDDLQTPAILFAGCR